MKLRTATLLDLDLLRLWDTLPHVVAATGADDAIDWQNELPRRVAWRELLMAEASGRPVGILQIIDPLEEETHYWGAVDANLRAIDIWIGAADDLGRGYGTCMMQLAFARSFADPAVTGIIIDPLERNERACRFYERLGFRFMERRLFGEDQCLVYRLSRSDWSSSSS